MDVEKIKKYWLRVIHKWYHALRRGGRRVFKVDFLKADTPFLDIKDDKK